MGAERKFICKIVTGSQLFGTNHANSDTDYLGVFLPSEEDLLGMKTCPNEINFSTKLVSDQKNTKDDIDCKFFSLRRFLDLAADGQPTQLEMLFAPDNKIIQTSPEWEYIRAQRAQFLSKKAVSPFCGFALAQAHRTVLRGDNLNKLIKLINFESQLTTGELHEPIKNFIVTDNTTKISYLAGVEIKWAPNDHGFWLVSIAGSDYDGGLNTKTFIANLKEKVAKYGERTKAAAENGFDWKSLMHAYRMVTEAKEFLMTGQITLPRPDAEFLKEVRWGKYEADHFSAIMKAIDDIKNIYLPASTLPEKVDFSKINQICNEMHRNHLTPNGLFHDRFTI